MVNKIILLSKQWDPFSGAEEGQEVHISRHGGNWLINDLVPIAPQEIETYVSHFVYITNENRTEYHLFPDLFKLHYFAYHHRLQKHGKWYFYTCTDVLLHELDEPEIPMIFRKWKDTGRVIAVMPTIAASVVNWWLCDSYMRVGKHGACDYQRAILPATFSAEPDEYAELLRELESAPYFYNVKIYKREQGWMREERKKYWKQFMTIGGE